MGIDTAKVTGCRQLRFETPEDLMRDVERLVAAERGGTLTRCGNWTLGQALGHLAAWVDYAFDGYPMKPPPWLIRVIVRFSKNKFVHDRMPRGVRIPGIEGGTKATEVISTDEGVARLERAWGRLRASKPTQKSPIFGAMTHEEWIGLNLRHAELHLGFFK